MSNAAKTRMSFLSAETPVEDEDDFDMEAFDDAAAMMVEALTIPAPVATDEAREPTSTGKDGPAPSGPRSLN